MAIEHVLTDADTIQGLAARFGITWTEIADYNGLDYPYTLTSDQSVDTLYASGYLKLTRALYSTALTVYKGSTFTTETDAQGILKTYQVVDNTVLPAGVQVGYAHVRCINYGTFGNTIASTIIKAGRVDTNLGEYNGFIDIQNEHPITNGTDARVLSTGQVIYIPADSRMGDSEVSNTDLASAAILALGGEDFELTPDGDLTDDGFGDIGTKAGIDNIAQSVSHRLTTRRGSLPKHPQYGSNLHSLVGKAYLPYINKLVELDIMDTLSFDERLGDVVINAITLGGSTVHVDLTVTVQGTSATINVRGDFGSTSDSPGTSED